MLTRGLSEKLVTLSFPGDFQSLDLRFVGTVALSLLFSRGGLVLV